MELKFVVLSPFTEFSQGKEKFSSSQKVEKSANTSSNLNETMRNKVGAKSVSIVTIKAMLHRKVIFSRCGSTSLKEPMNQRLQYHKSSEIANSE
jgi:hypothetical protein